MASTFRVAWRGLLGESGMRSFGSDREQLDLRSMERTYASIVEPLGGQLSEPFTTTAELSWRWDALHEARTRSTEEDVLRELLGQGGDKHRTARPLTSSCTRRFPGASHCPCHRRRCWRSGSRS